MPPLYEYICNECAFQFEVVKSVHADPTESELCPHCETDHTSKLFPLTGGYKMHSGGSSTRPRSAGSRPKGAK